MWRLFRIIMALSICVYEDLKDMSIVRGCPACPQPTVNIPDDWCNHPYKYATKQINSPPCLITCRVLLYSVCLSGDGNFHMQSRFLVKNLHQDPSFFGSSGFFVPYETYIKYTEAAQKIKLQSKVKLPNI